MSASDVETSEPDLSAAVQVVIDAIFVTELEPHSNHAQQTHKVDDLIAIDVEFFLTSKHS